MKSSTRCSTKSSFEVFETSSQLLLWLVTILVIMETGLLTGCRLRAVLAEKQLVAATARLSYRPVDAPLVGFPYRPARNIRGAEDNSTELLLLHGAAGDVLKQIKSDDPSAAHLRGVAMLFAGDPANAVAFLESATDRTPLDAKLWSDLAAALYQEGRRTDSAETIAHALGAAFRATVLDRTAAEPRFTYALALDSLKIRIAAERAFRDYLLLDGTSAWATEARAHLRTYPSDTVASRWTAILPTLEAACGRGDTTAATAIARQFPQHVRTWGEGEYLGQWGEARLRRDFDSATHLLNLGRCLGTALQQTSAEALLNDATKTIDRSSEVGIDRLANAHAVYRKARILYSTDQRRVAEALPLFAAAAADFRSSGSPMAFVADYFRANALFDTNDSDGALGLIDDIDKIAPLGYKALHAQLLWERSTILGSTGRAYEALNSASASRKLFVELGEIDHITMMERSAAAVQATLGNEADAWRLRRDAFERASQSGRTPVLESLSLSASVDALQRQDWGLAAALLDVQAHLPSTSPRLHAEALLWRALSISRLRGERDVTFSDAQAAAISIRDADLRDGTMDEIRFARAVADQTNPKLANDQLSRTITFRSKHSLLVSLPEAYVERARSWHALGDDGRAEADLDTAISLVEHQRQEIGDVFLRNSYLSATSEAFEQAFEFAARRGDYRRAFDIGERARAQSLVDVTRDIASPMHIADIQRALPAKTVVIQWTGLSDRTLAIVVSSSRVNGVWLSSSRADIERLRKQTMTAIAHNDETAAIAALERLHDAMLRPLLSTELGSADTIVLISDASTSDLPFAAMRDSAKHRYFVEDVTIINAPNASCYARHNVSEHRSVDRLAIVSDPAFSSSTFPSLARLVGAREEAKAIANVYRAPLLVDGADATKPNVVAAMQSADVVHLASHAIVNDHNPIYSVIPLAANGMLYVDDIARLKLTRSPIVVLAACRAAVAGGPGGGIRSFAAAFLGAGSSAVIAPVWEVSDINSRDLSLAFHKALRQGQAPANALRYSQLLMIHSPDINERAIRAWGGFQAYGSNYR